MNSLVPDAAERAAWPGSARLRGVTCKPLSVVLIGAGRRGLGVHVPALAASTVLRLAAIVETPERMAVLRATQELTASLHDSLAAGLEISDPALAIVATPPNSHVRLARPLLEAGIPTLVEKPPARNAAEFTELIQASRGHGTPLATILPLRYKARYQEFIRWLRSPGLTDAAVNITADVPSLPGIGNWRLSQESAGGGVLLDLGYNYLDLIVASLGRPDKWSAQLWARAQARDAVEDDAAVSMWFRERNLTISMRVRSGAGLTKSSHLLITRTGTVIYSSAAPAPRTVEPFAPPEPPPPGTDTLAQLESLLIAGFLAGRGEWDESLDKQLQVLSLVDDLYATADRLSKAPERTRTCEEPIPGSPLMADARYPPVRYTQYGQE
jgi:predicted dehydrogenase